MYVHVSICSINPHTLQSKKDEASFCLLSNVHSTSLKFQRPCCLQMSPKILACVIRADAWSCSGWVMCLCLLLMLLSWLHVWSHQVDSGLWLRSCNLWDKRIVEKGGVTEERKNLFLLFRCNIPFWANSSRELAHKSGPMPKVKKRTKKRQDKEILSLL